MTTKKIYTPRKPPVLRYRDIDLDGGQTPKEAAKIFDIIMNNTATGSSKNVVVVDGCCRYILFDPERLLKNVSLLQRITRRRKGTEYIKEVY